MTVAKRALQPQRRDARLGADYRVAPETVAIRDKTRDFVEQVLRPRAFALNTMPETRASFPHDILAAMAEAGLLGVPFARDVGGHGLDQPICALLAMLEEVGYVSPGIASALLDAQLILVGTTLDRAAPALRARYLPAIIAGRIVCSFATSEPDASTDLSPAQMRTVATRIPGGWRVNGTKRWITNAVAADVVLTLCRTDDDQQTLLLIPTRDNGVEVGDPDLKMGNHPQLTADIVFTDSFVPDDHVVGAVGGGLRAALGALMAGRIGIGAIGVGMAQAAFDIACDHMEQRQVFGRPLAAFQHWQFTFADHAIGLDQARALYRKAGGMFDDGLIPDSEAAMAKIAGSRLAVDVARDAVQVCGASGFARHIAGSGADRALEAIYRDAKIGEIYEGANEVQKWIIARRIFGRHLTG